MKFSTVLAAAVAGLASAQSSFKPVRPPAIPLAVKTPYLNAWIQAGSGGGNGGYLAANEWTDFWTGATQAWTGFIRVDGEHYTWMGNPPTGGGNTVNQTAFTYTSTRSTFTMNIKGKVEMRIEFMTPVTPKDLKRQSLVFSYLNVEVSSLDGSDHDVSIYADVSGEWAAGDAASVIEWQYDTSEGVGYHSFELRDQKPITETNQIPNWGTWFWSTEEGEGVTFQSGSDVDVRNKFVNDAKLANTKDTNFRAVNDKWPVFAFAKDLGSVGEDGVSTLFTLGLAQEDAIDLLGVGDGLTRYKSMWTSFFSNGVEAMAWHYKDFPQASQLATNLDEQIAKDSREAAGEDYLTITSLSVRQTFGALHYVNTPDDPIVFLKEISSNSDIQTVDVIYPAMPLFLYLDASIINYLLKPLYINQENGHYPNKFSIHDLGTYPLARGYPDGNDEHMPLEESANMIILSLAYAQRTGDNDFLSRHYPILNQWASFLVDEALIPAHQLSTDDFAGSLANQTNLALKGIIGLRAMAEIASLTDKADDSTKYKSTATDYITRWQGLGINTNANPPHSLLSYNEPESHGLLYNLYPAKLLGFDDFVPQKVYDMQSSFYPTQANKYGVPLDTRANLTKTDWQIWCAAIAETETRDLFLSRIVKWLGETSTYRAFSDLYETVTGNYPRSMFVARPVVGGHFALLALQK